MDPEATALEPAAAYVRMSTNDQGLSPESQMAAIRTYAEKHRMGIVATYSDLGKSGVDLRRRPGLKCLIADALKPDRQFSVLLVFDVSRWGRFQDIDESGHYEFLLRQAGVRVVYCAEMFENDGSALSSMVKALKRSMAGEYSRELSAKTRAGQRRLAERGHWTGGTPGYGLARLAVDADGSPRRLLAHDERKPHPSCHVRLVPGAPAEVAAVRKAFELFVYERWTQGQIASWLNENAPPRAHGRPWRPALVSFLLGNENYLGFVVFNKSEHRLGARADLPRGLWGKAKAFDPLVGPALFEAARLRLDTKSPSRGQQTVEDQLRAIWSREGRLTYALIAADPDLPSGRSVVARFKGLRNAYKAIGYPEQRDFSYLAHFKLLKPVRNGIAADLTNMLREMKLEASLLGPHLTVDGRLTVTIAVMMGRRDREGNLYWHLSAGRPRSPDLRAVALMLPDNVSVHARYLVPKCALHKNTQRIRAAGHPALEQYRCRDFRPLVAVALGATLREALSANQ